MSLLSFFNRNKEIILINDSFFLFFLFITFFDPFMKNSNPEICLNPFMKNSKPEICLNPFMKNSNPEICLNPFMKNSNPEICLNPFMKNSNPEKNNFESTVIFLRFFFIFLLVLILLVIGNIIFNNLGEANFPKFGLIDNGTNLLDLNYIIAVAGGSKIINKLPFSKGGQLKFLNKTDNRKERMIIRKTIFVKSKSMMGIAQSKLFLTKEKSKHIKNFHFRTMLSGRSFHLPRVAYHSLLTSNHVLEKTYKKKNQDLLREVVIKNCKDDVVIRIAIKKFALQENLCPLGRRLKSPSCFTRNSKL